MATMNNWITGFSVFAVLTLGCWCLLPVVFSLFLCLSLLCLFNHTSFYCLPPQTLYWFVYSGFVRHSNYLLSWLFSGIFFFYINFEILKSKTVKLLALYKIKLWLYIRRALNFYSIMPSHQECDYLCIFPFL